MPGDSRPRGGGGYRARGGHGGRGRGRGGGFSKANNYTNRKRTSPDANDDEDNAPRAKRAKASGAEGEEAEIVVPVLKVDEQGNDYVSVSLGLSSRGRVLGDLNKEGIW